MSSTRKKIPEFSSEAQEREFWRRKDSTDYIDWSKAHEATLPKLRPTLRTISIRLPEGMIAELKRLANKKDVPYQSLLKVFLAERIQDELAPVYRHRCSSAVLMAELLVRFALPDLSEPEFLQNLNHFAWLERRNFDQRYLTARTCVPMNSPSSCGSPSSRSISTTSLRFSLSSSRVSPWE